MIRVLMVDDHALFHDGLRAMLKHAEDIQIVGQALDGHEGITLADSLMPDVILMDVEMPGMDGIAATRALKAKGHPARVLMLTMKTSDADLRRATQCDADGFVVKDLTREELADAIRTVHLGQFVVSPSIATCYFASCAADHPRVRTQAH